MKKTITFLMMLMVILITAVSFSSCSKDDDNDNKQNNYDKAFVGAWELEGASSTRSLMLLRKDHTGQLISLTYDISNKLISWDIKDITWRVDESVLTTTYGAYSDYKYYTMVNEMNYFDWNWKSDSGTFIRLATNEYDDLFNSIPLNKSVIGIWERDDNTDVHKEFLVFYDDGTCQSLEMVYHDGVVDKWHITGYSWATDDTWIWLDNPNITAKLALTLSDKNKQMILQDDSYTRISEKSFKKYLNDANTGKLILGGWKDSAGKTSHGWGAFTQPYLCFFDDGSFRAITAWSNNDGDIYNHPNSFGHYQFKNARFTYDISNGTSKGSTLYLMTSNGGIRLFDIDTSYFGSGDFENVDDSEIMPLVEN